MSNEVPREDQNEPWNCKLSGKYIKNMKIIVKLYKTEWVTSTEEIRYKNFVIEVQSV